ncbi:MAG: hypothetical protein U1F16_05335 [Turneriella sp.]
MVAAEAKTPSCQSALSSGPKEKIDVTRQVVHRPAHVLGSTGSVEATTVALKRAGRQRGPW